MLPLILFVNESHTHSSELLIIFTLKVLVVKEVGIEKYKIQIPASMIKVNKSRKTKPLHTYVALSINSLFPSKRCMGRLHNDDLQDPTEKQLKKIKAPGPDVLKV